jgi:hypothetical protein
MNGGIWTAIIGSAGLLGALVLYLSFHGQQEFKVEQHIQRLEQKKDEKKFDKDFAKAWNGNSKFKTIETDDSDIDSLDTELAVEKAKLHKMEKFDQDLVTNGDKTFRNEDARLANGSKKAVAGSAVSAVPNTTPSPAERLK